MVPFRLEQLHKKQKREKFSLCICIENYYISCESFLWVVTLEILQGQKKGFTIRERTNSGTKPSLPS